MKHLICAAFDQEEPVFSAVAAARSANIPIHDVYTPYAVHGLDQAMGISRSRLPWACFIAGACGGTFALAFQMWTFAVNWPLIVGGKPYLAIPAFIPVTFELTVLAGGLATVAALLFRCRLFPGRASPSLDTRITDRMFVIAIEQHDASLDPQKVKEFFRTHGAVEIFERESQP